MNKEFRDLITLNKEEADVILVGVPFDKNASVGKGASFAPKVLRELSYELYYNADVKLLKKISECDRIFI